MGFLNIIIPFIILISIVVFVHEYGHYYYARKYGVKVTDFSIGFGKELFGWTDKHGTRWKLCLIPLGGYVKFFGDVNPASQPDQLSKFSDEEKTYLLSTKKLYQRAIIVSAGPIANFILALVELTVEEYKYDIFYDHGFCVPNYLDGVKLGVTTSFELTHESVGQPNQEFYQDKPLNIILPRSVEYEVLETESVVKGQTASGSFKPATIQNGLKIMVPAFINQGDKIIVDTETQEYLKKVS